MHGGRQSFLTVAALTDLFRLLPQEKRVGRTVGQMAGKTITDSHRTMHKGSGNDGVVADETEFLSGMNQSAVLGFALSMAIVAAFFRVGLVV